MVLNACAGPTMLLSLTLKLKGSDDAAESCTETERE